MTARIRNRTVRTPPAYPFPQRPHPGKRARRRRCKSGHNLDLPIDPDAGLRLGLYPKIIILTKL